jgi:hypothetical protein
MEIQVHAWVNPYRNFDGHIGTGTGFSLSSSVFPCQYHSTMTPYSCILWEINSRLSVTAVQRQSQPINMNNMNNPSALSWLYIGVALEVLGQNCV